MTIFTKTLRVAAGATCLAAALYVLLSMPGLTSDQDSTVPLSTGAELPR